MPSRLRLRRHLPEGSGPRLPWSPPYPVMPLPEPDAVRDASPPPPFPPLPPLPPVPDPLPLPLSPLPAEPVCPVEPAEDDCRKKTDAPDDVRAEEAEEKLELLPPWSRASNEPPESSEPRDDDELDDI